MDIIVVICSVVAIVFFVILIKAFASKYKGTVNGMKYGVGSDLFFKDTRNEFTNKYDKTILIEPLKINEVFNEFPFQTSFSNIKDYLDEESYEMLKKEQQEYIKAWNCAEAGLIKNFDIIYSELNSKIVGKFYLKIYNVFLEETFSFFKDNFIDSIQKIIEFTDEQDIKDALDKNLANFAFSLSFYFEILTAEMEKKLKKECNMISNLIYEL